MEKKTPLLDEIGRKHGMKVPGNYFADFTEKMTESLPEREFPELVQPSLWLRVRPWIYMAAMFVGAALIIRVASVNYKPETTETASIEAVEVDSDADEYINAVLDGSMMDDYSLYVYLTDASGE